MKVLLVAGARPNFMKIAPLIWELKRREKRKAHHRIDYKLVHTGQHYDVEMSEVFFREFQLPPPDINLGVGSGSHAVQTARIMIEFEKVILREKPDLVVVVGDVNSTLAAALDASKVGVKVAHVEAGLRSFDRSMPEEINRLLTDSLADYLFTTCSDANNNLRKEGIPAEKIYFVGNIMIDCLAKFRKQAEERQAFRRYGLESRKFALITLHRPSNVDEEESLKKIYKLLEKMSSRIPVIFPLHPRTGECIRNLRLSTGRNGSLIFEKPLSYVDLLSLMMNARFVLTDSGGIQEETTVLKIPCLTLRENTERPVTVRMGTNTLVGRDEKLIMDNVESILNNSYKNSARRPPLWDGKTASRIIDVIADVAKLYPG